MLIVLHERDMLPLLNYWSNSSSGSMSHHELKVLMGQGADVAAVREYLQNNGLYKYNTINRIDKVA